MKCNDCMVCRATFFYPSKQELLQDRQTSKSGDLEARGVKWFWSLLMRPHSSKQLYYHRLGNRLWRNQMMLRWIAPCYEEEGGYNLGMFTRRLAQVKMKFCNDTTLTAYFNRRDSINKSPVTLNKIYRIHSRSRRWRFCFINLEETYWEKPRSFVPRITWTVLPIFVESIDCKIWRSVTFIAYAIISIRWKRVHYISVSWLEGQGFQICNQR